MIIIRAAGYAALEGITMKRTIIPGLVALAAILILMPSAAFPAAMGDYCQVPPFVSNMVPPNVMLAIDVSGSMGMAAYQQASDRQRFCSGNPNIECDPDHASDCSRSWGTCDLGAGHHDGHCTLQDSGGHYRECHRDSDCTRSWGSCTSTATSLYYGTCSGNDLKGCNLGPTSNDGGCYTGGSCKCSSTEGTCDPTRPYEGYFRPDKFYLAGFCSVTTTRGCDSNTDCPSGETCSYINGYCSTDPGTSCQTAATCTGSSPKCRPTYYEYVPTGVTCSVNCDTPVCNTSRTTSSCAATKGTNGCASNKYYCGCSHFTYSGDCGTPDAGSWLNYLNMSRIDLLRWAMTGGAAATCTSSAPNFDNCDPRVYNNSGMTAAGKIGTVCKDTLQLNSTNTVQGHGCILRSNGITMGGGSSTETSVSVAVPWTGRLEDGLAFQFSSMPVKPRLGVYFFEGTQVKANSIYLGDFTAAGSRSNYMYQNLLTNVNSTPPGGMTPTAPAMWDIFNYYKQVSPEYGGINATSASNWKSPMYDCDGSGAGANCKYIPCVKNFVLLMSDGLWNQGGGPPANSSCSIDTGFDMHSADPVVPAYKMHMGFTNSNTSVATKVSAVYTVGMFVGTEGERALQNTAMYGSFDNSAKTWPSSLAGYPATTCTITSNGSGCSGTAKGSNCTVLPASSADWDKDANGVPDTYYIADDALNMRTNLLNAILSMLERVTSGTAASVLASGEGSGANLAQAIYYPRRGFYRNAADWVGGLQNFWYYVDPFFSSSNIREEGQNADGSGKDYILNLYAPSGGGIDNRDYILQFYYDPDRMQAGAKRYYDSAGDGKQGTLIDSIDFESLGNIWEAGKMLWARAAKDRALYTPLDTSQALTADVNKFSAYATGVNNVTSLRPFLNTDASAHAVATTQTTENNQLATNIVNWVRGEDQASYTYTGSLGSVVENYRSRTVDLSDTSGSGVWKLGDIIDSTPRILSWVPLNQYDKVYGDYTYTNFVKDTGSILAATATGRYRNRGTVFVGSNDGMLHAFRLGRLGLEWPSKTRTDTRKATLKYCSSDPNYACTVDTDCSGPGGTCVFASAYYCSNATGTTCSLDSDCPTGGTCMLDALGRELWAFIPKNVLPYLKYLKENDYCHLYGVDLTSFVFDASINIDGAAASQLLDCTDAKNPDTTFDYWKCKKSAKSWRTILIGGMRFGGACRGTTTVCSDVSGDGAKDCVNTPVDVGGSSVGYSSYFALDVTDPYVPKFLWEFSSPQLGYTTTGPAVIRISGRHADGTGSAPDSAADTNGRWFVVLGSGPTGPVETSEHQFLGRSDQGLRLFILDLKTGGLIRTIDAGTDLGITNAFAGSLLNGAHDDNLDYQDDVLYVGYTKRTGSGTAVSPYTWTDGGILRLMTRATWLNGSNISAAGTTALNPDNWVASKVIDGIGPVTSSVVRLQSKTTGKLWLYSGTGRYFFKLSNASDDANGQRHIFGLKEPCFSDGTFKAVCTDSVASNDLSIAGGLADLCFFNVNTTVAAGYTGDINNDSAYCGWKISLDASDTTYNAERVVTDPLSTSQGVVFFTTNKPYQSSCTTGGKTALWAVKYDTGAAPGALLKGKALIQVSTGSIEQIDLSAAFLQKGSRKTTDIEGVPPTAQGLSLILAPPPVKRVLHMKER